MGGISANLDLYLARGLYITGGVVQTNLDLGVTLKPTESMTVGDLTYEPEDLGELHVSILPKRNWLLMPASVLVAQYRGINDWLSTWNLALITWDRMLSI